MGLADLLDRLDLNDQAIVHQEIKPTSSGELHAFELDVDRLLPINSVPHSLQACSEDGLVNAFKKARTEFPMNSDRSADDIGTHFIDRFRADPLRLCVSA